MEALFLFFGAIFLLGALLIYGGLIWGFIIYKYYYWFVPILGIEYPLFTYWQCVALSFLLGLFKNHSTTALKKEFRDESGQWVNVIFMPWVYLFVGWLFTLIIK